MANVSGAQEREIKRKIGDSIDADGVADLIADIMEPEDLFREDQLRDWAEEHGFIAKENLHHWAEENGYVVVDEQAT